MRVDVDSLRHRLTAAMRGQLDIGDVIGTGASAVVFRGRDPMLDRDVAIKVIDPALAPTDALQTLFLNEARLVASLEHAHIVPLYSAESRDGLLFLVMRLLDGRSLSNRLQADGPLAPADAARIAQDVASALAAAHARGIVHRDIKPDNVLLDRAGRAFVTDFGIAHVISRARTEQVGFTSGTPDYMSPEQLLGEAVDGRTDVYATGVLLFEMLSGAPPFAANSIAAVLARHMTQPPPRLDTLRPDVPQPLQSIVEQALHKARDARPTAAQLVILLTGAQSPAALRSPIAVRQATRRRRAVRLSALTAVGVTVLALLLLAMWRVLSLVFADGGEPALNAFYEAIPAALIADARRDGSLRENDHLVYAYIPRGGDGSDALLLTDSTVVRRTPNGSRRLNGRTVEFDVSRRLHLFGPSTGYLVAKLPDGRRDTLFTQVTGVEAMRLGSALAAVAAAEKRRASPP